MITINYVLKEKNTVFVHENIVWKIELMNENVYAMSDIGHKNVCREYYYVLDEVKRIMKYWKKTQYYSLWQRKKNKSEGKN